MVIEVDLFSDTNTRPTSDMRRAIAEAEVGNEQAGEDPAVNELCDRVASLLGKEAAVYLPSGTMCNEIAYRVHCRPGDEILLDRTGHALHFETGAPAALAGAMIQTIDGVCGLFTADQVRAALRSPSRHHPRSRVLSVENTSNLGGGTVWPLKQIREVAAVARDHGLATHLDGARLLNAVVASGTSALDYAAPFDSAWIDFSKGLGAPVGAVLAGSHEFIEEAWRCKHQFGGAMRQAGIIAAACLFALDHHVERLAEDHANAKRLASGLASIPGVAVDVEAVETNIVFFDVSGTGMTAPAVADRLLRHGVRVGAFDERLMRAVTHLDVTRAGIEAALYAAGQVMARGE